MTAKYGVPYFSNFINSDMDPGDARSMCCRLRIDNRELVKRGGGLFGSNPLTGSIGVVTINLPRLGYLSTSETDFMSRLEALIDIASTSLEIKRKVLESFTQSNLYPYTKYYLIGMKQKFGDYWKNHFSTIGILGMNEACVNLFGKDIGTDQGRSFALRVSDFIRHKLLLLQEMTGNNYNFEATPAEGTSYRMARLDKKTIPDIICANEDAYRQGHEPYYTNSSQLPVNYTDDIFEALDLQDEIQTKYTGGTVMHLFAGERVDNPEVIKLLVKKICLGYKIPYFTFSPTFSVCPGHGYLTGNHTVCPDCGETTEVYSRVVGYLRPVAQWNNGKKEEFLQRKSFQVDKAIHTEEVAASQVYKIPAARGHIDTALEALRTLPEKEKDILRQV
jgi:ribonucleoside-triphosphate reductase